MKIDHRFNSVNHPYNNKQAEATNKVILVRLKWRVTTLKSNWVKELNNRVKSS